jgi:5-methylcytosine-specific restriction endonuclease McrA
MNPKTKLKNEADKLFKARVIDRAKGVCEVCGSTFSLTAHHFFPRSLAGHMMYYLPNGICLCRGCHFSHHTRSDPRVHQTIIYRKGRQWYEKLENMKKEQHSSFKTIKYYQDIIKELK